MADSFLMRITPRGISYPQRTWREGLHLAHLEMAKVALVVRSEVRSKVFGKALGMLFLAVEPIMMAFVYYVLTYIILSSGTSGSQFVSIYIAVVTWRWMSKSVDGSPTLFPGNAAVLKQTHFPVVSLLFIYMGVELVNFIISVIMLFLLCLMFGYKPNWAYFYLIFPVVAEASIIVLLTILFSCAGVFIRDLQAIVGSIIGIWFYLSPGIYPVQNVPAKFLWIYNLNPFAHILPAYQGIIMRGEAPDVGVLVLIFAFTALPIFGALVMLQRIRHYFFTFV